MSIKITARDRRGFRRCGIHHPPEPVVYADSHFSDEEIEILRREPDLIVELGVDVDHMTVVDGEAHVGDRSLYRELAERQSETTQDSTAAAVQASEEKQPEEKHPEVQIPDPLPVVGKLEEFLETITDPHVVIAMYDKDTRTSAEKFYQARLEQLEATPS